LKSGGLGGLDVLRGSTGYNSHAEKKPRIYGQFSKWTKNASLDEEMCEKAREKTSHKTYVMYTHVYK